MGGVRFTRGSGGSGFRQSLWADRPDAYAAGAGRGSSHRVALGDLRFGVGPYRFQRAARDPLFPNDGIIISGDGIVQCLRRFRQ